MGEMEKYENQEEWSKLTMIDYPKAKSQIAAIMLEKINEMEEKLFLANWYLQRQGDRG